MHSVFTQRMHFLYYLIDYALEFSYVAHSAGSIYLLEATILNMGNWSVWLAQMVKSLAAPMHGLLCAGGPGLITGADDLDSGFHPSGVGKMSSSQYVDGWPLQKTAKSKRAAVRWPRVAFAGSGAHYHP
jgi:hypothetical protein